MQRKRETRPIRQDRERVSRNNAMVSQPFANCTWRHGAALIAAFAITFAIIAFCETGVIPC